MCNRDRESGIIFTILGCFLAIEFRLNLVSTRGIVFRVVLDDVYVTGTVFIVCSYTSRKS